MKSQAERYQERRYRKMLASLNGRHATLAALVDFAEHDELWCLPYSHLIILALERRGLIRLNVEGINLEIRNLAIGNVGLPPAPPYVITDFGRDFAHWLRTRGLDNPDKPETPDDGVEQMELGL